MEVPDWFPLTSIGGHEGAGVVEEIGEGVTSVADVQAITLRRR